MRDVFGLTDGSVVLVLKNGCSSLRVCGLVKAGERKLPSLIPEERRDCVLQARSWYPVLPRDAIRRVFSAGLSEGG